MKANTLLSLKVNGVNAVHAACNQLAPSLFSAIRPFVGAKIILASGGFFKNFKEALPELPSTLEMSAWLRSTGYSLIAEFKTCQWEKNEEDGRSDHVVYHHHNLYLGDISNGVLTRLYDWKELRADHTVDEVLRLRQDYAEKKQAADEALSRLGEFGTGQFGC